jgi:outer membrane protein assembly complex protein YaeT
MKFIPTPLLLFLSTCLVGAAEIRISGLRSMSHNEALEILGERVELIKKKPANSSRASDAAFMLQSLMCLQGYSNASVSGTVEDGSVIHLQVTEGLRQYFGVISIEGVEGKKAEKMARLLTSEAEKRLVAFARDVPFLESDVATGLSYIQQEWQSRGYWAATVTERKRSAPDPNSKVNFFLLLNKGDLHYLSTPVITGNAAIKRSELDQTLSRFAGQPATTANINQMRSEVENLYRSAGYSNVVIRLGGEPRQGKFVPQISLQVGERQRLTKLSVKGLQKTKESRVLNRFRGMEGHYYDATRADKELRKLLNTGAFKSLGLQVSQPSDQPNIDATLHAVEGRARSFSGYAGLQSYEGPILGAGYGNRNIFGNLWNFSGGLEITGRGILFDTRIVDPWFLESDIRAGARFFAVSRDLDVYQKFESGFSFDLTWELSEHSTLLLFFASSYVGISNALIDDADLGSTDYNYDRVRLTWTYDRRNNKVTPSDGWIFDVAGELGAVLASEISSYAKWEMRGSWYVPVKETNHLALGVRTGLIVPATDTELPIDLRYFLGGSNTVRSFPERELGPRNASGVNSGGEAYWIANVEYVHQIAGAFKVVAFTDAGTLSQDLSSFSNSSIDVAVGLGVRLDLPIGPVRLEYGHNLTPDLGEPPGAFHFAIGLAF